MADRHQVPLPLITAYEAQLMEKEEEIQANVEEVEELRRSAEEVIRENQRLLRKLEETGGGAGPKARHSESWLNDIEEQARLVLEENQVVLEQMDLQQKKLHDQQRKHAQETIRLTKRLTMVESEKNSMEGELSELQMKYGALKDQHERSVREAESQMPVQEHLDTIAEYKRSMHDMKRQVEAETENTLSRLTAVETEKQSVAMRVADCQAENSQLKGEIQAMQKAQKRLQHKLTMLEKELSHSQSREQAANQHLNRVLEIAEQTAAERDSFKRC
ncbi:centrosomal protein of 89 kDa-like [Lytechinus variegatus]|uniref:centrosomal protein of 89 kDa-like n=1 Tax=Lytechinus variegatus TaxID=7654 RepID=UPI001BB0EDED|nr:centrosomal protein of 89 kDa-like [Lytechinus variegatus]